MRFRVVVLAQLTVGVRAGGVEITQRATLEAIGGGVIAQQVFNKHVTCRKLVQALSAGQWENSFKFAFVRNPYTWMQSWYRYRQRDELKDPEHQFNDRYTGNMSFNEFVQVFHTREIMLKQSSFVTDLGGRLLVDFVGRYERLQADFDLVCERLGLPGRTLPRVNASGAASEVGERLDRASLDIINDYFAPDFELFGYERQ